MSKKFNLPLIFSMMICLGACGMLAGCNMPGVEPSQVTLNVTQAYQTLQAKLTLAVGQTPLGTPSPDALEQEDAPTLTPSMDASATATATNLAADLITNTPNPQATQQSCDQAAAGYPKIDIEIEDDTEMAPGESFTKIWRIENVGTCTWTTDYEVVFFSGEIMDASPSQPLSGSVPPGSSIDISVNMVAPVQAGTFQGNWKLQNAEGEMFGIGPGGESPFWVRIRVVSGAAETSTPAPSPTPTLEVQVTGSISLALDDNLDLDTLLVNSENADIRYRKTLIDSRYQLIPSLGVMMSLFGEVQPTFSDCQAANLSNTPVFINDLPVGTFICYRTNLGLPGWARYDGIATDTEILTLAVLTWRMP